MIDFKPDYLKRYSSEQLLSFYKAIVLPRLIEEKMLLLLRQGKVSKWFSGIGQEAIAVGVGLALAEDEYILPLHRNLGVFTTRNIPLEQLFNQLQGKFAGFTKGRDRSYHFGTLKHKIVGMISHLGPQLAVADGIALAHRLRGEQKATVVFSGDGGTSQGDFHEALNVASVWKLPVIFLIENNAYGLSTPTSDQYACNSLVDRAIGYGMRGKRIDGNNLLEVLSTLEDELRIIRENPEPVLIECMTFRVRGHEEASGTKYVPQELIAEWIKKDPVVNYESFLLKNNVASNEALEKIKSDLNALINNAIEIALSSPEAVANTAVEVNDVYAPIAPFKVEPKTSKKSKKRFVDAVSDGLRSAMRTFPNCIIMGQDVAEYGGVFKVTENFVSEFGTTRVRNTPLCESAIIGTSLGLAIEGFKAVVEMQFADFISSGFNQVVNNLAKVHYRWGVAADVVIRMPTGAGVRAGPFHSQSNESWFTHTPGLKVVFPSTAYDAKGLLLAAIADPNPVLYFEHKALYRKIEEDIPDDDYTVEIGKARKVLEGSDLTIITYGLGVHWALQYLAENSNISATVLDLRTLVPLDFEAVTDAVKASGRVLILHEDTLTGGYGGELAALIAEHCFNDLDAPIMRCASLDTPVPFAAQLEDNFLANSRLAETIKRLLAF